MKVHQLYLLKHLNKLSRLKPADKIYTQNKRLTTKNVKLDKIFHRPSGNISIDLRSLHHDWVASNIDSEVSLCQLFL